MDDVTDRLQSLYRQGGFTSLAKAAEAYGIGYETYKKIMGRAPGRELQPDDCRAIARYHNVSPGWLLFGDGSPSGETSVDLKGYVSAGEVTLFEDIGEDGSQVDGLIAGPDVYALEVRGDSMLPLAHNGDVIFVGEPRRDVSRMIGRECAVQLQDGRRLFKILERGSKPGLYDLRSYNAETIRDVDVHSAGLFFGVKRR